jgi:hypothetical protein
MRRTRSRGVGSAGTAAALTLALLAGSIGAFPRHAIAGSTGSTQPTQGETGFGGVSLPVDLVVGEVTLRARRAWVWRIPEPRGPETIRIVLEHDVTTLLGPNQLSAERASLWLRPIGVGGVGDASGIFEVFGYYERVDSPGGPASLGFSAEKLPVQALIAASEPVRLAVDLRLNTRPDAKSEAAAFASRADESFASILESIRNPEAARAARAPAEEPLAPPAWILNRRLPGAPAERSPGEGGSSDASGADSEGESQPAGRRIADRSVRPGRSVRFRTEGERPSGERVASPPAPREPRATPGPTEPVASQPAPFRAGAEPPASPPPEPSPTDQPTSPPPASEPGAGDPRTPTSPASPPEAGTPGEPEVDQTADADPPQAVDEDATGEPAEPLGIEAPRIFSSGGVFFFSAGERATIERAEDANLVTLTGGVVLQHEAPGRVMEMTARRAVLFLAPGPLSETLGRLDVADVTGIYLEGGVRVSDGQYTLRSPAVFYDVREDRALLLDAVFNTYDRRLRMPLTMRAGVIRQEAANRFSAERAVYANTAFATPQLAIGTGRMTISQKQHDDGEQSNTVDARHITLRAGGVPFFYWPWFRGDPERFPLRSIGIEDSNRTGTAFLTSWDPFTLLGIDPPDGVTATADLDYYADRGVGLGGRLSWDRPRMSGLLRGYVLPEDNGTDVMRNGAEIEREGETRGFAILEHRWQFLPEWTLLLNGFHASDEAILPALFRDVGVNDEELTTRAHLRRLENDTAITLEAKGLTTDFIPNEHLAQSPGYAVDKLPEIGIAKIGDDLLDDLAPGWLTHTWNADASRMRLRFQEITPASIGLRNRAQANRAFGVGPNDPIADAARDAGLNESFVNRFDTRHELSTKFNLGPVHVSPFLVGRFTAYDTDFESFSPDEGDEMRLWGAAGVTLSTSIFRVDDSVESRTFDLHRMRHIIEPTVTLWHGGGTIDSADLPVYDDDVESLAEGSAVRVGLNQTWQTKRGAPGRWRTVDVFTLDAEYGVFSDDANEETPIGRYYSARPELSAPDEFVRVAGTWQVSEVVGFTGETIWDVDDQREDRNSAGVIVQHSERLSSRMEVRRLEHQDDTFGNAQLRGTFGDKYIYSLNTTYNFREEDFQNFSISLYRRFTNGMLGGTINYNNISGETTFGLFVQPAGVGGAGVGGLGGRNSRY